MLSGDKAANQRVGTMYENPAPITLRLLLLGLVLGTVTGCSDDSPGTEQTDIAEDIAESDPFSTDGIGEPLDADVHEDAADQVDATEPDESDPIDLDMTQDGESIDTGCGCDDGNSCNEDGLCVPDDCPENCRRDCQQGCFALGSCIASDAELDLHANIITAGVLVSLPGGPEIAEVYYRRFGDAFWSRGHDAIPIPDGRLASSLFYLTAATDYHVMVRSFEEHACGEVTTEPVDPGHTTSTEIYVDAAAEAGNGTAETPFPTIQEALDSAILGADIHVAPGVYHEALVVSTSGIEANFIRIVAQPGAILDGADQTLDETPLTWVDDGDFVWRTEWSGDPRYIVRDGERMYHYLSRSDLEDGVGDDDIPIDEGFYAEPGWLYVRCLDDPSTHDWQIPVLNTAITVHDVEWIWIEGLEIRFYGDGDYAKGIDIRDSDHVVVRDNHIHDIPSPVWIRVDANFVRVEDNRIHLTPGADWPWDAIKGTDHENVAIMAAGGRGAIIAGNEITDIFNGIASGSFSDDQNPLISFDLDVYDNSLADIGDDGLEPEGACINNRFWENRIDRVHNGISLAPITYGPTWVIRNRFTDYGQSGFKVSNSSSGRVWLYHNTSFTDRENQNGMNVSGYFENMVFRNNIIRGTRYALEMSQNAGPNDLDWDNLFTIRGAPIIKWDNVRYNSLEDWCAATELGCHGQPLAPGLIAPTEGQFALAEGSPNEDAGIHIYGINDDFEGEAPDIGYLELGSVEVPPLDE